MSSIIACGYCHQILTAEETSALKIDVALGKEIWFSRRGYLAIRELSRKNSKKFVVNVSLRNIVGVSA